METPFVYTDIKRLESPAKPWGGNTAPAILYDAKCQSPRTIQPKSQYVYI